MPLLIHPIGEGALIAPPRGSQAGKTTGSSGQSQAGVGPDSARNTDQREEALESTAEAIDDSRCEAASQRRGPGVAELGLCIFFGEA